MQQSGVTRSEPSKVQGCGELLLVSLLPFGREVCLATGTT